MMYKLTLILFAFFSLVFPILAVPIRVLNEIDGPARPDTTHAGTSYAGRGTFYYPGLGACGKTNSNDQLVVAIPTNIYGSGTHCSQQVNIHYGDKSIQATAVDKCPGCGDQGIDMSPATFQKLAALTVGVIEVTWNFV